MVTGSVVSENKARLGGGVYSTDADIVGSQIRGNEALTGGGVYAGRLLLSDSSVVRNSAVGGGGVLTSPGSGLQTTIRNSTVAQNEASVGAGIGVTRGRVVVEFSTVSGNLATTGIGAGIRSETSPSSVIELHSTIVAGNQGEDVSTLGSGNDFVSGGYNLIGTGNSASSFMQPGDQVDVIDPLLGPLVYNGGPMFLDGTGVLTHALLPGSPAIDAGDPAAVAGMDGVPEFDQRGMPWVRVAKG